jgi:hypothetical protein
MRPEQNMLDYPLHACSCEVFHTTQAYFATTVSYAHKMFMALAPGQDAGDVGVDGGVDLGLLEERVPHVEEAARAVGPEMGGTIIECSHFLCLRPYFLSCVTLL